MSDKPVPPNIVLLMADQLTPFALPFYGHRSVRTPACVPIETRARAS